eukprot:scaffold229924_cov15-Tisochrysis_lutea.AAC.2
MDASVSVTSKGLFVRPSGRVETSLFYSLPHLSESVIKLGLSRKQSILAIAHDPGPARTVVTLNEGFIKLKICCLGHGKTYPARSQPTWD